MYDTINIIQLLIFRFCDKIRAMPIIWSFILGALQGITEILPISSSAHLIVLPKIFNIPDQGLAYDVSLHLGSLVAIIVAFKSEWQEFFKASAHLAKQKLKANNHYQKMIYYLILATIPGAVFGYLFEEKAESIFRSPQLIIFTLVFYALILLIAEKSGKKKKSFSDISFKDALFIGLAQALAIVPGTSRSGVTISAGLFSGLKKEEAAKFSFILSAPIIFGAGLVKTPDINFSDIGGVSFWVGVFTAFAFTFISIRFLLRFVKSKSYNWFVAYRLILAAVLAFIFLRSA